MEEFLNIIESNKIYFNFPKELHTLLINSETPIYYIEELKNLRTIKIYGEEIQYQKEKIDYSEINKFENLEDLVIIDNYNIEEINVSNLKKLHTIILLNNKNLKKINGLENLKQLNTIIIVGNKIKKINEFRKFLENTIQSKIIKLDINMYHYLNKSDIIESRNNTINFAEKISVGQFYNLTLDMMEELYRKGIEIIEKIDKKEKLEIAKEIYKYLVKTLTYDYENLELRNKYILEGKSIEVYKNDYKDINSSYCALMNNKVVCEGYANAFRFLTNIKNIEAENITCYLKKANKVFEYYNHTASRFRIDNQWLYCDAQIEENDIEYFGLKREEFEKTHKLQPEYQKRIGENK
jgi:hypothetical protein